MTTPTPALARESATVVVLREVHPPFEVLLVQRHIDSRAFGGAHVFPGGVVEAADESPVFHAVSPRMSPTTAAERMGDAASPASAFASWIAAIRELFEEAGILIAHVDGRPLALGDPTVNARFREHRAALIAGHLTFADLVVNEHLALGTDALAYWSRWITPVNAPRRYDARFFVARLPLGQEPLHDDRETIATTWCTPRAALEETRAQRMVLTPPTLRTLEDLEACDTVERIFETASRRVVTPILPKTVEVDGRMAVLYPGDDDYDGAIPGTRLDGTRSGRRNRLVMGAEGWRSFRPTD